MSDFNEDFLKFTVKIYSKTGQGDDRNFLISPLSLALGLGMVYAGTRKSSESDLKHLLQYGHLSNDDIHKSHNGLLEHINTLQNNINIKLAMRIFSKKSANIKPEYAELLKKYYNNEVQSIDFSDTASAAKQIQDFLDANLKTTLSRPITACYLNSDINALLMSAISFKGHWFKKFDKEKTHKDKFYCLDGTVEEVEMMTLLNRKFKLKQSAGEINAAALELPYLGETLALTVILPHEGFDVKTVEAQFTPETLKETLEEYNFTTKTDVYLPKFKIEDSLELTDAIKSLNGGKVVKGFRADFTGMTDDGDYFLSKTVHKNVFEVDEEGTESVAAMTNPKVSWSRGGNPSVGSEQFVCNRPFLFIVHDNKYHLPLLMGKYTKP